MLISIRPKYSVAQVVGYIKGKSAIHIARTYLGQKKNYGGMSFWARGYFVSTVGTDEGVVRTYIREQEKEDSRLEQLSLLTRERFKNSMSGLVAKITTFNILIKFDDP